MVKAVDKREVVAEQVQLVEKQQDECQEERVEFDDVLVELGDWGRYQRRAYFLLFLPTIFSAMQKQSWVFLGAK